MAYHNGMALVIGAHNRRREMVRKENLSVIAGAAAAWRVAKNA
jgi:hypothetical protein